MRTAPLAVRIAAAALALLVAACSDGGASTAVPSPSATSAAPTGTASVTPEPTANASTATATATATPAGEVTSTFTIPTDELPIVRFTTAEGATVDLPVEVPPASEYGVGLSGRTALEGRGMVFYYAGESGGPGFWMRNTLIDLDIAFIAGDGTIISIHQMQADTLDIHHPGRAYLAGIEAASGWYGEHGIEAGDAAEFLFDVEAVIGGE